MLSDWILRGAQIMFRVRRVVIGPSESKGTRVRRLSIKSDSELITGHVDKYYKAQHPELVKYLAAVRGMEKYFLGFDVKSFPRALNKEADELAKVVAHASRHFLRYIEAWLDTQ
jgi:hypothetical protein